MAIRQGDTISRDPTHVANTIGEYFEQISSLTAYPDGFLATQNGIRCLPTDVTIPDDLQNSDFNKPFTIDELFFALDVKKGKSAGPDEISYPLLQRLPMDQ